MRRVPDVALCERLLGVRATGRHRRRARAHDRLAARRHGEARGRLTPRAAAGPGRHAHRHHRRGTHGARACRSARRRRPPRRGVRARRTAWRPRDLARLRAVHLGPLLPRDPSVGHGARGLPASHRARRAPALARDPDRLLRGPRVPPALERARLPALPAARPVEQVPAGGDDPLLLAHPRLEAARVDDRRAVPGASLRTRDLREDVEAAPARQARRELPARLGRVHLDLRQAAVLGARRGGAKRVARLRFRRLPRGLRPPARAHHRRGRQRAPRHRGDVRAAAVGRRHRSRNRRRRREASTR